MERRSWDRRVMDLLTWANLGKGIAAYLLVTEAPVDQEWTLAILLLALIAPDVLKRIASIRYGKPK